MTRPRPRSAVETPPGPIDSRSVSKGGRDPQVHERSTRLTVSPGGAAREKLVRWSRTRFPVRGAPPVPSAATCSRTSFRLGHALENALEKSVLLVPLPVERVGIGQLPHCIEIRQGRSFKRRSERRLWLRGRSPRRVHVSPIVRSDVPLCPGDVEKAVQPMRRRRHVHLVQRPNRWEARAQTQGHAMEGQNRRSAHVVGLRFAAPVAKRCCGCTKEGEAPLACARAPRAGR